MYDAKALPSQPFVADEAAEAFTVLGGRADGGAVILCDHAENRFPPEYQALGLPQPETERHIAYDIGVAGVVRHMHAALGVPAILSRFSRLLIDPNRGLDDPTLIMQLSDGTLVPGNRNIGEPERERRIARFYAPYHDAVRRVIDRCLVAHAPPALVSVHSYTPEMQGVARRWHAAILWDKDPRLALPLLGALGQEEGLVVGNNEPYTGRIRGDSMWMHGTERGLAHAIIEVRQDLIRHADGQRAWGNRLSRIVKELLADSRLAPDLRTVRHYGSHTDHPISEEQP